MPPKKCLKIRLSKGESESILAIFQWKIVEFQFIMSFKFYFSIKSRLIAIYIEYSYVSCMHDNLFICSYQAFRYS